MNTIINQPTRERLALIAQALRKLYDNGWIRDTGENVLREAMQELDDINGKAVEPITNPPDTVLVAMTPEQVEAVVDRVIAAIPAATDPDVIVVAIKGALESTELAVVDAIAQTRADVLGAIPTPAPAPAIEATE